MLVSAKKLLSDGIDPSQEKQRQKRQNIRVSQNDFEQVAKEWWEYQRGTWTEDHANRVCSRLKDNTFTELGLIEINELHPQRYYRGYSKDRKAWWPRCCAKGFTGRASYF